MEKDNNLKITKQSDKNFLLVMELAVPNGYPVLI